MFNAKVLVVGDTCLDIIEEGECTRISPEAPVPVIKNPKKKYSLGMAANVALNLKNLGADVYLSSWANNDKYGHVLAELLAENDIKISNKGYKTPNNRDLTTTVKKRIFANGQQVARLDKECDFVDEYFLDHVKKDFDIYEEDEFDFIVISDYNKGFITNETWKLYKPLLDKYNKSGLYFVDTKKKNVLDFYEKMTIFPNEKEMRDILSYNNLDSVMDLVNLMNNVIVETKSSKGSRIITDGTIYGYPALSQDVIDVTGAGDTFISAFALYMNKYRNAYNAQHFANYACSKVIQKKGTTPITIEDVNNYANL